MPGSRRRGQGLSPSIFYVAQFPTACIRPQSQSKFRSQYCEQFLGQAHWQREIIQSSGRWCCVDCTSQMFIMMNDWGVSGVYTENLYKMKSLKRQRGCKVSALRNIGPHRISVRIDLSLVVSIGCDILLPTAPLLSCSLLSTQSCTHQISCFFLVSIPFSY